MSRVGLKPIIVPEGLTVEVKDGGTFGYKEVFVRGTKGELSVSLRPGIEVVMNGNEIKVTRIEENDQLKAFHGLYRSLISNMVIGLTEGFSRRLELVGIGYRAEMQGNTLVLSVGYSHKINYEAPANIIITVEDQTKIKVEGFDKQRVGEVAAKIRSYRKPEPYKGKGIKYDDEIVKRKSAKAAVAA